MKLTKLLIRFERAGPVLNIDTSIIPHWPDMICQTLLETPEAYAPIPLNITKPSAEGDLVITPTEKNEIGEARPAKNRNVEIAEIEIHNSMMESLPSISASV